MSVVDCVDRRIDILKGKSVNKAEWDVYPADEDRISYIMKNFDVPYILARIMQVREIDNVEEFLNPKLRNSLPNPYLLKDMDKAIDRIIQSITRGERIAIFGDYDVDGATSSAMMYRYFSELNLDVDVYIPDRMLDGYGPNIKALKNMKDKGVDLCITVDCGTVSFDVLSEAKQYGLDVIVVDHHISENRLPDAIAVVNPNRFDEEFAHKDLAAVGVCFLLLVALNSALRKNSIVNESMIPDLMSYLDLVALGTVCDVMKLEGLNRAFVYRGLRKINEKHNVGIAVLLQSLKIFNDIESYHLGFVIGPRINAGGRIGDSSLGSKLLSTKEYTVASSIVKELEALNHLRKDMEKIAFVEAVKQVEEYLYKNKISDPKLVLVSGRWHMGIIGIVASRLKDKYMVPAIAISLNEEGLGRASARSVKGIDLGRVVHKAHADGLLLDGGGHAMAAGFSLYEDKIDPLREFLLNNISYDDNVEINESKCVDDILNLSDITWELLSSLQLAAPFGVSNPDPTFIIAEVVINDILSSTKIVSDTIRCTLTDIKRETYIRAVAFRGEGTKLGELLKYSLDSGATIAVLGKLKAHNRYTRNNFNSNSDMRIQFIIEDAKIIES